MTLLGHISALTRKPVLDEAVRTSAGGFVAGTLFRVRGGPTAHKNRAPDTKYIEDLAALAYGMPEPCRGSFHVLK